VLALTVLQVADFNSPHVVTKHSARGARILGLNAATDVSRCHFKMRRGSLQSCFVHYTF
jgi:hypothetical protein